MTGLVIGLNGTILQTRDGGLNWVAQDSGGTSATFTHVSLLPHGEALVIGVDGVVLQSFDGGEHWVRQPNITEYFLFGLSRVASDQWVVAGSPGTVLRLTSRGWVVLRAMGHDPAGGVSAGIRAGLHRPVALEWSLDFDIGTEDVTVVGAGAETIVSVTLPVAPENSARFWRARLD